MENNDGKKAPTVRLRITFSGKPPEGGATSCSLCASSFPTAKALYGHMRWHGKASPPPAPSSPPGPAVSLPPRPPQPPLGGWSRTAKRTPLVPVEIFHAEVFDEREEEQREDAAALEHPSEEQRKDAAALEHPSEESCTDPAGAVASPEVDPGALEQSGQTHEPSEDRPPCACCRRWLSQRPCSLPAPSTFPCSPCGRTFPSYHALCGHMASHPKQQHGPLSPQESCYLYSATSPAEGMITPAAASKVRRGVKRAKTAEHRCNVCGRVFPTGQALGGHKRLHWRGPATCPPLLLLPPASASAGDQKGAAGTAARVHDFDLNETPVVEDGEAANGQELLLLLL